MALTTNGLVLHLEADAGVTFSSGTSVSGWADQSGQGNHLIVAGGTPTHNPAGTPAGAAAINFDGVDDYLNRSYETDLLTGLPENADDRTMVFVARYSGGGGFGGFVYGRDTANSAFGLIANTETLPKLIVQAYGSNDMLTAQKVTEHGWAVYTVRVLSNQVRVYVNSTQVETDVARTYLTKYNTAAGKIRIGREIGTGGYAKMDMAAGLIYNRALTDQEIADTTAALTTKYIATGSAVDRTPDAIAFTAVPGAVVGSENTSNAQSITGIATGETLPVAITGTATFLKNAVVTSLPANVTLNDTVALRVTAPAAGTTVSPTLQLDGVDAATYSVTSAGTATTTTVITRHEFTWTFDGAFSHGTFTTGDPYIVAPNGATLLSVTPAWDGTRHGSMVNITVDTDQAFDSRMKLVPYSAALNVAASLPSVIAANSSLMSANSKQDAVTGDDPILLSIGILTVLPAEPAAGSFRPGYVGSDKTIVANVADMDYTQLGSLPRASLSEWSSPPNDYAPNFERPWIEYQRDYTGRYTHPELHMPPYGREMAYQINDAALVLQLDYTNLEKELLLKRIVQYGIDNSAAIAVGMQWWAGGGHNQGRKIPTLIAGRVLNNATILAHSDASLNFVFQEDQQHFYVSQADVDLARYTADGRQRDPYTVDMIGTPEWGEQHSGDPKRDGSNWNVLYRDIANSATVGSMTAALIMPGAATQWNWPVLFDYYRDRYIPRQSSLRSYATNQYRPNHAEMYDLYVAETGGVTPVDRTPNPISFTAATGATPGDTETSNTVTILGITPGESLALTIAGTATVLVNSVAVSLPATVTLNDTITLEVTAPAFEATESVDLILDGVTRATYSVTSKADVVAPESDLTPNAIDDLLIENAELSALHSYTLPALSGFDGFLPATLTNGGELTVNGTVVTLPFDVSAGDLLKIENNASGLHSTYATTSLEVGGVRVTTFRILTKAAAVVGDTKITITVLISPVVTPVISPVVTSCVQ